MRFVVVLDALAANGLAVTADRLREYADLL